MKKILMFAGLALWAGAVLAEDGTDFKWDGEARLRYQNDKDQWGTDQNFADWTQRAKLGVTARKGDSLAGRIGLIHNTAWGDTGQMSDATQPWQKNQNTATSGAAVNEAYVWWKLNDRCTWKFGRANYSFGNGKTMGANDWEAAPSTFDGLWMMHDWDFAKTTLFGSQLRELSRAAGLNSDPQENLYGLVFDFKNLPDWLNMANIHVMKITQDETAAAAKDYLRYGIALGGEKDNFDYMLTGNWQDGKDKAGTVETKRMTYMYDVAVGYKFSDMMNGHLTAGFHQDSGDDDSDTTTNKLYQGLSYNRHGAAGMMDVLAYGNMTNFNVGYQFDPMDDTTVGLKYWSFSRTSEKDAVAFGNDASNAGSTATAGIQYQNTAGANTEKTVGSEIDVWATHKYGNGFSMLGTVGFFTPGDYLKKTATQTLDTKSYNQFRLQGTLTF